MNSLTGGKKEWMTQLSSAGLIYFHFGHRVISTITGDNVRTDPFRIFESVDSIDVKVGIDGPDKLTKILL